MFMFKFLSTKYHVGTMIFNLKTIHLDKDVQVNKVLINSWLLLFQCPAGHQIVTYSFIHR